MEIWGRRIKGTTSACAENTARDSNVVRRSWNYLRVRGEYARPDSTHSLIAELPPRARRIHQPHAGESDSLGTTSACAENTLLVQEALPWSENYLRVRGEYRIRLMRFCRRSELPPRARRIQAASRTNNPATGTTSACAENTAAEGTKKRKKRNYLRVRGEYRSEALGVPPSRELPPRARRIRRLQTRFGSVIGTTSACAENTLMILGMMFCCRNYLRVRGEYSYAMLWMLISPELPPRARRIRRCGR